MAAPVQTPSYLQIIAYVSTTHPYVCYCLLVVLLAFPLVAETIAFVVKCIAKPEELQILKATLVIVPSQLTPYIAI